MKATLWFGAVVVLIVLVVGGLLAVLFSAPAERKAIVMSAVVAVVVQLFAFSMARVVGSSRFLAGWVLGVALRFVTLLAYGIVAVKGLGMPAAAALISLATFLFISTLIEPKLLTT
jgi:hypothetical protein